MRRIRRFFLGVVIMLAVSPVLAAWAAPGLTDTTGIKSPAEEDKIKSVITDYFETRYLGFNSLQMDGFENLIANSPEGDSFLQAELDKLKLQLANAEVNRLRYVHYVFFLDFIDISIDSSEEIATAIVIEGHDVVFEISQDISPLDPTVSSMRNLAHTIVLSKEQGQWNIVSDYYEDHLWDTIRKSGKTTDELLRFIIEPQSSIQSKETALSTSTCSLQDDDSTHPYDREGAVAYAHLWATATPPYNSPPYDDFTDLGGDCTNFVSQAIHEGGNAPMVYFDDCVDCTGTKGWFYTDMTHRARAWNDVQSIYDFITDYKSYPLPDDDPDGPGGPEGCKVNNPGQLEIGDLIQFQWIEPNTSWDHTVIVVDTEPVILVAAHSLDYDDYYLTDYIVQATRYIHIERIDGYDTAPTPPPTPTLPPTATPVPPQTVRVRINQSNDDAGTNPSPCSFIATDPEVYLGACFNSGNITSGFRFNAVQIPRGAVIENAYITFTVDGDYTVAIKVEIYGEATGNSATFNTSSPPANRHTTNSSTLWGITDTWKVGDRRNTPNFSSVIQEIVNQADWNSGNSLSIIIKNVDSGTAHRRVIAFERASVRPDFDPAELVVTYTLGSAPSATPTSVIPSPPTPTPVPTTAIPPTATPKPWYCFCNLFCPNSTRLLASESLGFGTPTPMPAHSPYRSLAQQAVEISELTTLLYRVKDEIMSQSAEGQRLIDLYYDYAPNIAELLLADENLFDQGGRVLMSFVPGLQALLDGNGDTVTITEEQVIEAQAFLDVLLDKGDTDLRNVISTELEHHPLESMIGITMDKALTYTNGYQLTWRPPLSVANPYIAQSGRTIPVEFTLTDFQDNFAIDENVTLQVVDNAGNIVVDPVVLGSNPKNGIVIQGNKYHYNLQTNDLSAGFYTLQVFYNSTAPNEPATWTIRIKGK